MFDKLINFINNKNSNKSNNINDSENDDENKSNKFTYLETKYIEPRYRSKYINNNNLYDVKETIKVIVLVGSDYKIGNISYTSTHLRKDGTLTNYPYEAWKLIQNELEKLNKYNFEIYLTDPENVNYTQTIEFLNENKYDVAIASYNLTEERMKLADVTLPIQLDSLGILYKKSDFEYVVFLKIFKKLFYVFVFMILMGIILGSLLYLIEPKRAYEVIKHSGIKSNNKILLSFKRTILTTIAAMFGEAGFLAENSTLKLKGILTVIIIFIISYLIIAYIQSIIITNVLEHSGEDVIQRKNIYNMKLLALKGYAEVAKLEQYDTFKHLTLVDGNIRDLEDNLLKNDDIDGIVMGVVDSYPIKSSNDQLGHANKSFDNTNKYFFVNKTKPHLKDDINKSIAKLYDTFELRRLCKSYFPEPRFICNSLR
jgi:ABC-type amino acid transport substrate-binding protein